MSETEDWHDEELLVEFLDESWGRLERGQQPDPAMLTDPALAARGERLLADLLMVLAAAGELSSEGNRLLADSVDLSESGLTADPPPGTLADPLPDPFPGEFRVRSLLGRGAFGKVFLADDIGLSRPVALKAVLTGGRHATEDRLRML